MVPCSLDSCVQPEVQVRLYPTVIHLRRQRLEVGVVRGLRGSTVRFKIGFTGTQEGMTERQKVNFMQVFLWFESRHGARNLEFHQGQCIGGDEDSLVLVKSREGVWTVSHPPLDKRRTHSMECDEVRPGYPFLERNHNIVDEVAVLLAAPRSRKEELRSGTWATVRYARKINRPYEMIWP